MISVQEARQIIDESVTFKNIQTVPLLQAFGLVTAEDIIAAVSIPNFAQSSMDGYALKFEDRSKELQIIGEMPAGATVKLSIQTGQATRIFTGAPLPEGADTVVMQEKVIVENGILKIHDENLSQGLNARPKGSEVQEGEIAMKQGTFLSAAAIGFLAGIGCTEVPVYSPPEVSIILTGDELQEQGKLLEFGQVYEANSFQLKAALQKAGIKNIGVMHADDDPEALQKCLQYALATSQVVLLTGGVSVGDYDYVPAAAEACGIEQKFHKIKQRPGKPLFFGTKGDKTVFGLPGNPSSSLTCFYEYVLPALEKMMQLPNSIVKTTATATHNYKKPQGLTHFLKAFYADGTVTPLHAQESYRLHSFAQANCFLVLPEASEGCTEGDSAEVHLLPL
ncbi:molybdopterin-binding protein [Flavobacterium akiainvivens]|uniref:Molybdopterin molybdenumtransferase n=1 Tax=Flavobacterium akiainvivens TaxID=1202724 RepID=A0A0M8MGJ1_9FLAO|nr:gephyrin-like molybdotransferase Glp [Flavobacterium akiainvivens]KOS05128.1 molybdopterin-binding protein [Flavobacterium akiainvivens]SFQ51365.1 molybdopterin molybdochelatase [Flavobacterium akiainvivens]